MKNLMVRILVYCIIICTLTITIITGCAPQPSATSGGVLKLIGNLDAINLGFPPVVRTLYDYMYSSANIETLARYDEKGNFVPWLAESWTTDANARTITFKLKKGIKFQDGTDFNAAAVQWNIQKYLEAGRTELPKNLTTDIIDDYTIRLNLSEWNNTVLEAMQVYKFAGCMVSPTAWKNAPGALTDKDRDNWAFNNPVGTGPFQLVSWQKTSKQVYKKNPNYWQKGKPYLDGLEYSIIADPLVASAAFQSKEADVIWNFSVSTATTLKQAGFQITPLKSNLGASLKVVMFNSANPNSPWSNVKLRQALSYAIDSKAIVDGVFSGYGSVSNQWNPPPNIEGNPDVKGYPFNPNKAKQMVADAGYPNGFKAKLLVTNNPDEVNTATAIQGMLKAANIEVELDVAAPSRMMQVSINGPESLSLSTFSIGSLATLLPRVGKNSQLFKVSLAHFDDLENLIVDVTKAPNDQKKIELIRQAQQLIFDKYCIFTPVVIISGLASKQTYVKDDNLMQIEMTSWTPETAWLNK